jgi:hypothetical protein
LKTSVAQDSVESDLQIGHELLHIFVSDLLGRTTPAALIYHSKMNAEFRHTRVVTFTLKVIVVMILIGLNAFFAYYSVLKGYVQGVGWQYNYLFACIMQLFSEILFFETMENFWMHFLIPSFATKDVQSAFRRILKTIQTLCSGKQPRIAGQDISEEAVNREFQERYHFNTAEHWYISYQIARNFPHLMESMMILSYSTPYPGELAHKWKAIYQLTWREMITKWCTQLFFAPSPEQTDAPVSVSMFLFMFIQWFVAFPYELQRMLVRFFMPFVFSALVMLWQMIEDPIVAYVVLALIILVLFGGLVGFYLYSLTVPSPVSSVTPLPPTDAINNVIEERLPTMNDANPRWQDEVEKADYPLHRTPPLGHNSTSSSPAPQYESINHQDFHPVKRTHKQEEDDDGSSLFTLSNDYLTSDGEDESPLQQQRSRLASPHHQSSSSSSSTTASVVF